MSSGLHGLRPAIALIPTPAGATSAVWMTPPPAATPIMERLLSLRRMQPDAKAYPGPPRRPGDGQASLACGCGSWTLHKKSLWAMSQGFLISKAMPNRHFATLGLVSIEQRCRELQAKAALGRVQLNLGLG